MYPNLNFSNTLSKQFHICDAKSIDMRYEKEKKSGMAKAGHCACVHNIL